MPGVTSGLATPGLATYLSTLRSHSADVSLDRLVALLKLRQIEHPSPCAVATTHLLIRVVAESRPATVDELLARVRTVGRRLQAAHPQELTLGNIVRRALGLIREIAEGGGKGEEEAALEGRGAAQPVPAGLVASVFGSHVEETRLRTRDLPADRLREIKEDTLQGLREILDELEQADEQIAGHAQDTVQRGDTILTFTGSLTVQKFLLAAAKALAVSKTRKTRFNVLLVEGYPNEHASTADVWTHGHTKAGQEEASGSLAGEQARYKSIAAAGIDVTVIPDAAVRAFMPRVNKVILPAYGLLPNGGFVGSAGALMIARAASQLATPVIVLGGIYKLSPLWPFDTDALLEWGNPDNVVTYSDGDFVDKVDIYNARTDYIPPELVSLYLTNIGGHAPSYMYRIAADHYRSEDAEM